MKDGDGAVRHPFDVVGLGFNTLDHVCVSRRPVGFESKQRLDAYHRQPGGQVPTALVALQRWGLRCSYVGPLGDDEGGRLQRDSLLAEGVDIRATVQRSGIASQTSFIFVDGITGERTIAWDRPSGLALSADEIDRSAVAAGRVLLSDGEGAQRSLPALRAARAAGSTVVLDVDAPGPETAELLAAADVVVVSDQFSRRFAGGDPRRCLRRIREGGPSLAAVTLGLGGTVALSDEGFVHEPARRVPVVDTTSAGDLFHAGCVYGLLAGWPLRRMLRFASAAAALECMALGGRAAIPPLAAVDRLAAE